MLDHTFSQKLDKDFCEKYLDPKPTENSKLYDNFIQ